MEARPGCRPSERSWGTSRRRRSSRRRRPRARSSARTSSPRPSCRSGCRRPSSSRCWPPSSTPSRSIPSVADVVASAMKDWAIEKGATHYAHVFYPLTGLTAEKHDSFLEPDADRCVDRRVRRQDADPGRARRVELPQRWPAGHLRGPGLHRLGRDQPRLHPREPEREHAVHPDRVRVDDRRGPRPQDAAPALAAGDGGAGRARPAPVRPRGSRRGRVLRRRRAGVLPDRPQLLPRPSRPARVGPHPVRGQAAEGPGVRRPLLRCDPRAGARLHVRRRARAVQARHPGQDPAQRGRPGPVRAGADVRAGQRRGRPPAAADGDPQEGGAEARHGVPLPREALRRASTGRASTSTSRSATRPRATCCSRATPPTTTRSSSCSAPR